jgi:hypothetical protein
MGRTGWLRIYMGPGQRITIADGDYWRVRAIGTRGSMIPVIFDSSGLRIAMAGSNHGTYGITGRDFACSLYPAENPLVGRANKWTLRQFEDELATITRYPLSVEAKLPTHLGAVFLSSFSCAMVYPTIRYQVSHRSDGTRDNTPTEEHHFLPDSRCCRWDDGRRRGGARCAGFSSVA